MSLFVFRLNIVYLFESSERMMKYFISLQTSTRYKYKLSNTVFRVFCKYKSYLKALFVSLQSDIITAQLKMAVKWTNLELSKEFMA